MLVEIEENLPLAFENDFYTRSGPLEIHPAERFSRTEGPQESTLRQCNRPSKRERNRSLFILKNKTRKLLVTIYMLKILVRTSFRVNAPANAAFSAIYIWYSGSSLLISSGSTITNAGRGNLSCSTRTRIV